MSEQPTPATLQCLATSDFLRPSTVKAKRRQATMSIEGYTWVALELLATLSLSWVLPPPCNSLYRG